MVRLMNELIVGVFLFLSGHAHFLSYWNSGELSLRKVLKVRGSILEGGYQLVQPMFILMFIQSTFFATSVP